MHLEKILKLLPLREGDIYCSTLDYHIKAKAIHEDKNGMILFRGKPIVWNELKSGFKDGSINRDEMMAVNCLRRLTVMYLIKKLRLGKKCYTELGSTTLTSDLDFTYVSYTNPSLVTERLIVFYKEFKKMYGNYPDVTFDTNYYISNAIVASDCFKSVRSKEIRSLFKKIPHKTFYHLINYRKPESKLALDFQNCFAVQMRQRDHLLRHHHHDDDDKTNTNKLHHMIQTATMFYDMLQQEMKPKDDKILFVRTLYYLLCLYSNESYISDGALMIILFNITPKHQEEAFLAFVDQYLFVLEWYTIFGRSKDLIPFFDMASKYINRAHICLEKSQSKLRLDTELVRNAKFWVENIRGKMSFREAKKKFKPLFDYVNDVLKSPKNVMGMIEPIFEQIRKVLENPNSENYVENVMKEVKKIKVNFP